MALTEIPSELSSTPSIVDNGNATAITIDASENATFAGGVNVTGALTVDTNTLVVDATNNRVGISTSSPSVNLEITESGSATNSVADVLRLNHITSGTAASGLGAGVVFSSERPSGGINLTRGAIYGVSGSDPDDDGALAFYTRTDTSGSGFSEKLRLDSSGNLLAGKTTSAFSSNGVELRSNGALWATVTGQGAASFNIKGTDGVITDFYKDGTTVGSIGSEGGNSLFIANDDAGFRFSGSSNAIVPCGVAGASSNGLLSLGLSGLRFKDLYLSGTATVGVNGTEYANNYLRFKPTGAAFIDHLTVGQDINFRVSNASGLDKTPLTLKSDGVAYMPNGIYLGGTAAANKLDHYEEVAWTPTQAGVTLSVTKARALRVGNLVTLNARISWPANNDSTTVALGGLPFPAQSTWEGTGSIMAHYAVLDSTRTQLNSYMGGSSINFYKTGSGVTWVALNNASLSGADVIFTLSYLAS